MSFEDDGSLRVNFTDVEGQKEFTPVPPSKQNVIVSDFQTGTVSEASKNAGAPKLSVEFTVQDGDYDGRRIWDTFTIVDASMWKLKAFLTAIGEDTEGELDVTPDEYVGRELVVRLAIQPARKNERTGDEYPARNNVKAYYPAAE
jgi:hypothetical protein